VEDAVVVIFNLQNRGEEKKKKTKMNKVPYFAQFQKV
jgi:hypothetical protein